MLVFLSRVFRGGLSAFQRGYSGRSRWVVGRPRRVNTAAAASSWLRQSLRPPGWPWSENRLCDSHTVAHPHNQPVKRPGVGVTPWRMYVAAIPGCPTDGAQRPRPPWRTPAKVCRAAETQPGLAEANSLEGVTDTSQATRLPPPVLPPVDHLPSVMLQRTILVALNAIPDELKTHGIRWTYVHMVRLTEKAIREYNAARNAYAEADSIDESEEGDSVWVRKAHLAGCGTDHLDTCVDATHRAITAAKRLFGKGIGSAADLPDQDASNRLNAIRDAMQHADDRLMADNLRAGRLPFGPGDPFGINPREDELTIGAEKPVRYVELVGLMESCYRFADVGGTMSPSGEITFQVRAARGQ